MDELNYIGDLFRDKLKNHKIEPSDKVWANIQKNIGSAPVVSPKPSFVKYFIGGAAIVSIVVATVAIAYYFNSNTTEPNHTKTITQTENTNKTIANNEVIAPQKLDNNFTPTTKEVTSNEPITIVAPQKATTVQPVIKAVEQKNAPVASPTTNLEKLQAPFNNNQPKKEVAISKLTKTENTEEPKTLPVLDITNDTTICVGESFRLKAKGGLSVMWSTGEITDEITVLEVKEEQVLTFRAFIHTLAGDTSVVIKVKAIDCHEYEQPNAFTPNGDGKNDLFIPNIPSDCSDYSLMIYNRSGLKVFESRVKEYGWDGKYNSEDQKEGAYFYILQFRDKSNNIKTSRGTIILLPRQE